MANISRKRRQMKIKQGQKRSKKLQGLKDKYFKAKTKNEKDKFVEKFKKLAPQLSAKEYFKKNK